MYTQSMLNYFCPPCTLHHQCVCPAESSVKWFATEKKIQKHPPVKYVIVLLYYRTPPDQRCSPPSFAVPTMIPIHRQHGNSDLIYATYPRVVCTLREHIQCAEPLNLEKFKRHPPPTIFTISSTRHPSFVVLKVHHPFFLTWKHID